MDWVTIGKPQSMRRVYESLGGKVGSFCPLNATCS